MNINMFFEFPGILITIGVVLLIISILIILIAIRTDKKAELDFVTSENEAFDNKENKVSKEKSLEEIKEDDTSSDNELNTPMEEENYDDDIELL